MHKPRFWITVALLAVAIAISFAPFLLFPADGVSSEPGTPTFESAWLFVALSESMAALMAGMFGAMLTIVDRSVVDIVYPAPLDRGAVLRGRIFRAVLAAAVGVLVFGLLLGVAGERLLGATAWLVAARSVVVFLPVVGFWLTAGVFLGYASSRVSERVQNVAVLLGLLLVFAGLPSLITFNLKFQDDPLIVLLSRLAIPAANLLVGVALTPPEALALGLEWAAFLAMAATSVRWPYVLFEDSGTRSARTVGALTQERAPSPRIWREIALRLRVAYVDLGSGGAALLGRNLTVSFRGSNLAMQIMFLAMLGLFVIPFSRGGTSFFSRFSLPVVLGGVFAGALGAAAGAVQSEGVQGELVRLLPLPRHDVYLAYVTPTIFWTLIWASLVAATTALAGAGAVLAFLAFATILSITAFTSSWSFLAGSLLPSGSPSTPPLRPAAGAQAGLIMVPLFIVMLELTPLVLFSRGPVAAFLAAVVGLNAGLTALSFVGAMVALRRPPNR